MIHQKGVCLHDVTESHENRSDESNCMKIVTVFILQQQECVGLLLR